MKQQQCGTDVGDDGAGMQQQGQESWQAPPGSGPRLVHMSALLTLSPPEVEAAYWQSSPAQRLLRVTDTLSLSYSVLTQTVILVKRRSQLAGVYNATFLAYVLMSCVQLTVLFARPQLHQRWRFEVTAFNRVLRLATCTAVCLSLSATNRDFVRAPGATQSWLHLLRPMVGPSLLVLNHACFVLAFKWVLPAQLWTLAVSLPLLQTYVCGMASAPQLLAMSEQACVATKRGMHTASLAFGRPPDVAAPPYAQECQGVAGLLLLCAFVHVLLLVLLPCLAVYLAELRLKVRFVRAQGAARMLLCDTWAAMDSAFIQAVYVVAAVVGSFFACELLVLAAGPRGCTSSGALVFGPA